MGRLTRRKMLQLTGSAALAGALGACAGATPAPAGGATTAPGAAQPPAAAAEKASIIAVDTGDGAALTATFVPFMEKNPDIVVEVIGVAWDGFDEKVDLLIAGGDAPAIWRPGAKRGYRYYADKGMFPDLEPLIERDSYDIEDFYEVLLDFVTWEGKIRGFPAAHYLSTLYYNKTLFDQAGVPLPPTTWDDTDWTWQAYLEAVGTINQKSENPLETVWGSGAPFDLRHSPWIFGGDYFDDQGYVTGKPDRTIVNSAVVIDGWTYMQDMIYTHGYQPTPAEGEIITAAGIDLFLSGKVGMMMNANWSFGTYAEIEEFEWGIAPVPYSPTGRKTLLFPDQWMMFAEQKHPDAAWEALKYAASAEGASVYYMGVNVDKLGGIPSRKSLAATWTSIAEDQAGLTAAMVDGVINQGIDVAGKVTASHAIIKFAEVYDVAVTPQLDNLFLNKITAQEAAATMEPKINEILAG